MVVQVQTRSALSQRAAVERGPRLWLGRLLLGTALALGVWGLLLLLGGVARADPPADHPQGGNSSHSAAVAAPTPGNSQGHPGTGPQGKGSGGSGSAGDPSAKAAADAPGKAGDPPGRPAGEAAGNPPGQTAEPPPGQGGPPRGNGVPGSGANSGQTADGSLAVGAPGVDPAATVADVPAAVSAVLAPGSADEQTGAVPGDPPPSPTSLTPPSGPSAGQASAGHDQEGPADTRRLTTPATYRTIGGAVAQRASLDSAPLGSVEPPVGPILPCAPLAPLSGGSGLCLTGTMRNSGGGGAGSSRKALPLVAVVLRSGTPSSGVAMSYPDLAGEGVLTGRIDDPATTPD
jgi:hypothetical protein